MFLKLLMDINYNSKVKKPKSMRVLLSVLSINSVLTIIGSEFSIFPSI